jgi:alpha-galactosidase
MKYILVAVFSTFLSQSASSADLTGRWVAETQAPNGEKRQTIFAFKSEGDKLAGYLVSTQGDDPIADGKIAGDTISFVVIGDFYGQERRTEYTGRITADGLVISAVGGRGGRGPRELLAKRVSTVAPTLLPPAAKIALPPPSAAVPPNGLARTPPMGWNSWNKFQRRVNDQVVREVASAMAKNGMKDAGYVYVNIDDTWQGTRDAQGNIRANEKFPDMKALAGYVHGLGMKLGIYSSPGPRTCAGFEGSYQHEEQDAKTFAAWGIDYLKYDWCSASRVFQLSSMPAVYAKMGQALHDAGRPIVYSLCQYGMLNVGEWGRTVGGNLWRTTGDIRDAWASMTDLGFEKQAGLEKYSGPGHWNDPDMLEIGNGSMSLDESRVHMSLWSILAAPLIAGNDLRDMPADISAILTNKEVIAVDQDELGKQGVRVAKNGDLEVWSRPLAGGALAVGLFNRGADHAKVTARWSDLAISGSKNVRDLWTHADRGKASGEYSADVASHGVVMLKLW